MNNTNESLAADYREPGSQAWDGWMVRAVCTHISLAFLGVMAAMCLIVACTSFCIPSLSPSSPVASNIFFRLVGGAILVLGSAIFFGVFCCCVKQFCDDREKRRRREKAILRLLECQHQESSSDSP